MKYLLTVALPAAPPSLIGRLLVPEPREFPTVREADAWSRRNADSWRDALLPGETYFTAWILDELRVPVRTLEFPSASGAEPVVLGRKALGEMGASE